MAERGSGGWAKVCAVPRGQPQARGAASAAAASGAGVDQDVVVAPVLEPALSLTASVALGVKELAALPLLSPQPASKTAPA